MFAKDFLFKETQKKKKRIRGTSNGKEGAVMKRVSQPIQRQNILQSVVVLKIFTRQTHRLTD